MILGRLQTVESCLLSTFKTSLCCSFSPAADNRSQVVRLNKTNQQFWVSLIVNIGSTSTLLFSIQQNFTSLFPGNRNQDSNIRLSQVCIPRLQEGGREGGPPVRAVTVTVPEFSQHFLTCRNILCTHCVQSVYSVSVQCTVHSSDGDTALSLIIAPS